MIEIRVQTPAGSAAFTDFARAKQLAEANGWHWLGFDLNGQRVILQRVRFADRLDLWVLASVEPIPAGTDSWARGAGGGRMGE